MLGTLLVIVSSVIYMFEKWFVIYHWTIVINKINPFPSEPNSPNFVIAIVFFILGIAFIAYHFKENNS